MRTKNAKRLWPVPVTLGGMALAALLAFGLLAANGAPPAMAHEDTGTHTVDTNLQDHDDAGCHIHTEDQNLANDEDSGAPGTDLSCSFSGDSAEITFIGGTSEAILYLYIQDDDGSVERYLPGTTYGNIGPSDPNVADEDTYLMGETAVDSPTSFRVETVPLKAQAYDAQEEAIVRDVQTVTIAGGNPSDTVVYIYDSTEIVTTVVGAQNPDNPAGEVPTASDVLQADGGGHHVTLQLDFLGEPVERDTDDDDSKGSEIMVPAFIEGDDAMVTVIAKDANGHVLSGNVTLTVDDTSGDAELAISETNSGIKALDDMGMAMFTVEGLPEKDAVRIPITATLQTNTGPLTLTGHVSRIGAADMITSMTYLCDRVNMVTQAEAEAEAEDDLTEALDLCEVEARGLATKATSDDPRAAAVFEPGSAFLIQSKVVDKLDQDLKQDSLASTNRVDLRATEVPAQGESKVGFDFGPYVDPVDKTDMVVAQIGYITVEVPGKDGIETGMYTLSVQDRAKKATAEMISITVSGPPKNYAVTGAMWIPLDGEKAYTVTATDENGNIPVEPSDGYEVTIRVRGQALKQADDVVGLTNSMVSINPAKGTGTFTILAPVEASQGDSATIRVIVNDVVQDTMTVYFGDAPAMPDMPGMPMNVMAEATSDTMITVTWDAVMDATSYMVERGYMDADNMMMWMTVAEMTTDMMYMDSGLMAETAYYYRVTAMNDAGPGDASDGTAMATTMMATTMMDELGTAMGVVFGVNRGGSLHVSWTKAANASGYIIIAINVNDVNGDVVSVPLNDGDLETWNIGGLTRGATYDIYVAATASGGRNTLSDAARVTAQ